MAAAVHTSLQQVHDLCGVATFLQYSTMLLAVTNIACGRDVAHMTVWGLSLIANTMLVRGTALTAGHRQMHSIVVHDDHCVGCCTVVLHFMNRFFARKLAHILLLQPSPWQMGMLTLLRK